MNIKGAIFDMDGTLVDSLMLWDILWEEFGTKYLNGVKFVPDKEADKAIRTMPLREAMEYLHECCGVGESGYDLFVTASEVFRNFYANRVTLKEGAKEFLEYLYDKGVKMCVASATDPDLVQVSMEHCGIEQYFSKLFSCSQLGKGKDQPDLYLMAREYLGTPLEETWVFEDAFVALNTASNIGMPTVGVYDCHNFDPDKVASKATLYIGPGEKLTKLIANGDAE